MSAAKDAHIAHHVTMAQVQYNDGYKPRCRYCFVPCDPRDRDYRGRKLCSFCAREDFPGFVIQQKVQHDAA